MAALPVISGRDAVKAFEKIRFKTTKGEATSFSIMPTGAIYRCPIIKSSIGER